MSKTTAAQNNEEFTFSDLISEVASSEDPLAAKIVDQAIAFLERAPNPKTVRISPNMLVIAMLKKDTSITEKDARTRIAKVIKNRTKLVGAKGINGGYYLSGHAPPPRPSVKKAGTSSEAVKATGT